MTDEQNKYEQGLKKTQKVILFLVIPILVLSALGVFIQSNGVLNEKKPTYVEILSKIDDLHCYNVNWFGVHGFQITYKDSIDVIVGILDKYDIDFSNDEFFKNKEVVNYLILNCPHIDNTSQAPDKFDRSIGVSALDKCLQVKQGFVESEDYCLQFKK